MSKRSGNILAVIITIAMIVEILLLTALALFVIIS
jgi:hypothetical protein